MSTGTTSLKDIYLDVAGDDPITEAQEEGPSHDPIEEREAAMEEEVSSFVQDNGLDDAVDGAEVGV